MRFRKWIKLGIILMSLSHGSLASVQIPAQAGLWARPAHARTITPDSIFAYMDGAGELYIGYRFDRLEVYEYTAPDAYDILVEIYYLDSSDDAFGLLSLDWGGEPFSLPQEGTIDSSGFQVPARALYGAGLLRLWCGTVYARIMAYNETDASRDAVMQIGTFIAEQLAPAPAPNLLNQMPEVPLPGCLIPRQQVSFFRSYLVLNSLFYLSEENILHLDLDCAAVMAKCAFDAQNSQSWILLIQYPDASKASGALHSFISHFLPELTNGERFRQIEEGWCGYRIQESVLTIVFSAPNREWAEKIVNSIPF